MKYKMYAAFIASLGVALTLVSNETFGGSAAVQVGRSASTHPTFRAAVAQSRQHHQGRNMRILGVQGSGFGYGSWYGEPRVDITQSIPNNIHYTYTYEPLWDAAHRYPQAVSHSEPVVSPVEVGVRPIVPGCPEQTVTVPMADGKEQAISIVRCY
jgi:hypothetical protein